ncbi:MAG: hypothetical protein ACFE8A_02490 [Candidatus Hodarchaeota archaeon]
MALDVDKELKIFWIAGLIVLLIYGLWFFISYESYYAILGTAGYFAPVTARVVGAVFISWAIIVIRLLKKLDNWEKIEEWVLFAVMAQILIFIAELIGIIMYNVFSAGTIIAMIVNLFFAILGIHIIIQKRK